MQKMSTFFKKIEIFFCFFKKEQIYHNLNKPLLSVPPRLFCKNFIHTLAAHEMKWCCLNRRMLTSSLFPIPYSFFPLPYFLLPSCCRIKGDKIRFFCQVKKHLTFYIFSGNIIFVFETQKNSVWRDGWAGLRRTPGKCVLVNPNRGFESLSLRQKSARFVRLLPILLMTYSLFLFPKKIFLIFTEAGQEQRTIFRQSPLFLKIFW